MARWKARVEFLLSVIELLFLSLTVEALQGKCVKTHCLQEGVGQFSQLDFRGKGSFALQHCHCHFLYNETLQQTSRPLLWKLYERRQI